jgi:hypothetical protein
MLCSDATNRFDNSIVGNMDNITPSSDSYSTVRSTSNDISHDKIYISTTVCIAEIDSVFDIASIFAHLKIDDEIIGTKYHNRIKGKIKATGSFFNQITVVLYVKKCNKQVNLKLFGNGKVQFSGVRTELQASLALKIFLYRISEIHGRKYVNVIYNDSDNILYNKYEYNLFKNSAHVRFDSIKFYGCFEGEYRVIGERKGKDFVLNKVSVEIFDKNYFIESRHLDYKRKMFNRNGEYVGYLEYTFLRKRKNVILKYHTFERTSDTNFKIYDKYKRYIGDQNLVLEKNKIPVLANVDRIELDYSCVSKMEIIDQIVSGDYFTDDFEKTIKLRTININCNYAYNTLHRIIDRSAFHNLLNERFPVLSYFNHDSKYQAINVKIFLDANLQVCSSKEAYERKITLLIFQNGKVIISGCINKKQILVASRYLTKIINENQNSIFVKERIKTSIVDTEISIWDIV